MWYKVTLIVHSIGLLLVFTSVITHLVGSFYRYTNYHLYDRLMDVSLILVGIGGTLAFVVAGVMFGTLRCNEQGCCHQRTIIHPGGVPNGIFEVDQLNLV